MQARNDLAAIRQKRGIAVATLAAQIGVKRQTIYAIEAGSYIPNTLVALRLAQALEVSVEDLFSIEKERNALPSCERVDLLVPSHGETLQPSQPVRLCRVGRRVVAVPASPIPTGLPNADGLVLKVDRLNRGTVQPLGEEVSPANALVVAGCDPGMSVLARHLRGYSDAQLIVAGCSSSQALRWLKEKKIHVAGTHLRDEPTGESNLPAVRKLFPRGGYRVITFANWEEGLVVAAGEPQTCSSHRRLVTEKYPLRQPRTWGRKSFPAGLLAPKAGHCSLGRAWLRTDSVWTYAGCLVCPQRGSGLLHRCSGGRPSLRVGLRTASRGAL